MPERKTPNGKRKIQAISTFDVLRFSFRAAFFQPSARGLSRLIVASCLLAGAWPGSTSKAAQDVRADVIVVETARGEFSFETYPDEAPRTVKHVVELVKAGFYDGQRVHRALPGFVVQWGDPQSRDTSKEALWGRGPAAGSGTPIGAAEMSKKRTHVKGAVAVAHPGNPALADSQIYVTLANRSELNGAYTVFGRVVSGEDVADGLQKGDVILRMFVRQ